ncbi:hypothetical protein F4860DRAFT_486852 [Xylaria cubensis]|nr:hypothetical protein F4860DRAFT_486852 [Xylaria cubensis]
MSCFNRIKAPNDEANKAKHFIQGPLRSKSYPLESPRGSCPILPCLPLPPCRMSTNRLGRIFNNNNPLQPQPIPWKAPAIRSNRYALLEIRRCIRRGVHTTTASSYKNDDDEVDMLANRVYSMLRLEKNPVIEYLERKGSDFARLRPEVRREFEETVWAEVRLLLRIGVAF